MTTKPIINQVPNLPSIIVHSYERYLPTAFDESMTLLQKMNKVINHLNDIGEITNNITTQWNEVMEWIVSNGLTEIVSAEIDKRILDGTFNELITNIVGDLTLLETDVKTDMVNAINEVNKIATENDNEIGDISLLNTLNKNNIVEALNEMLFQVIINKNAPTSVGEATGHGIISGLKVRQQSVLAMAVEIGNNVDPNIVHMKSGARYTLNSATLAVNPPHATLDRIDNIYVSENGVISYVAGVPSITPIPPLLAVGDELLAEISVRVTDTTINDIDITDKRSLKSLTELSTSHKENFVLAINEVIEESATKLDVGDKTLLATTDKTSIVNAINEVIGESATKLEVGDKSLLATTDKTSIVNAINEVIGESATKVDVGDKALLTTTIKTSIVNAINEVIEESATKLDVGDKALLTTVDKTSIVNAINEVIDNLDDTITLSIGDKSTLKTVDKSTIVNALNEVIDNLDDTINSSIGDKNSLETINKSSIVVAINEIHNERKKNTKKIEGRISILDFDHLVVDKGLPTEDWRNAFQSAMDSLKTTSSKQLVFPSGIYPYSVSPNWAIADGEIVSEGEVRLRYTGTEHAVFIDGGVGDMYNMRMGRFIVEAPTTAKDGVYINRVHHGHFDFRVRGAGGNYSGVHVQFSVCSVFDLEVSANAEGGWYQDAMPRNGLRLSKFSPGLIPSYNTFINPVIEWSVEGGKIEDSIGNVFIGGTMEGCGDIGLWLTPEAGLNKFFGLDLEANGGNDVYCEGFQNEFHGMDTIKLLVLSPTARDNKVIGGNHRTVLLELGSTRNLISGINYNRQLFDGNTGYMSDLGTMNRFANNTNIIDNLIGNKSPLVEVINLSASPFTYTNTTGNDERIIINGGVISDLTFIRGTTEQALNSTEGFITLSPKDKIRVSYTGVPFMKKYTT